MFLPRSTVSRWFLAAASLVVASGIWGLSQAGSPNHAGKSETVWVYVGTYTQGTSKGIYRYELDPASGKLTPQGLAAEAVDPSFLALDPSRASFMP